MSKPFRATLEPTVPLKQLRAASSMVTDAAFSGRVARSVGTHLLLDSSGNPIELGRSDDEVALLAFDVARRVCLELHVLDSGSQCMGPHGIRSLARLQEWQKVHARSFAQVRSCGMEEGLLYYTCDLNDGESLERYVARFGAIAHDAAFRLVGQLLDDLVFWMDTPSGVECASLSNLMVVAEGINQISLRVTDLGVLRGAASVSFNHAAQNLTVQICHVLIRLLTGKMIEPPYDRQLRYLDCLPPRLEAILLESVWKPDVVPCSLMQLRYYVFMATNACPGEMHPAPRPLSPLAGKIMMSPATPGDAPRAISSTDTRRQRSMAYTGKTDWNAA